MDGPHRQSTGSRGPTARGTRRRVGPAAHAPRDARAGQGVAGLDALATRGRQRAAEPLPDLLSALPALGDRPSQADPPCRPNRRSTRLTAAAVRRQGIGPPGSPAAERPTVPPIPAPLHARGSSPPQVAHSQPPPQPRNGPARRRSAREPSGR
jgi:hypothetical protein